MVGSRRGPAAPRGAWRWPELDRVAVPAVAMAVYLATMAPSVTWSNSGADGAELAAAAYVWGVAHPPGYPLYLTLARLFEWLPVGEPIWRVALLSAAAAAAAVALVQAVVLELVGPADDRNSPAARAGAAFAAATFAFGTLLWSQATVAEVYTLGAALLAGLLLATARWLRAPTRRRTLVMVGLLALLCSHHPVFVILIPLVGWLAVRRGVLGRDWAPALAVLLVGPLLMLTLWARAAAQPAMNWGDPSTLDRWLAHVTAQQYRGYFLELPLAAQAERARSVMLLLLGQVGVLGLVAAGVGLARLWRRERAFAVLGLGLALICTALPMLYSARDSEVYLIPAAQVLAVAGGVGAAAALARASRGAGIALRLALAVAVGSALLSGWPRVDVSREAAARAWAEGRLRDLPPGAVYRTASDEQSFALWYLQVVDGTRPDVAVVDERLLAHAWYRGQLARRYPALAGQLEAEPARPAAAPEVLPTRRPAPGR